MAEVGSPRPRPPTLLRRFASHRGGVLSLVVLGAVIALSLAGERLWRYDYAQITSEFSSPPSWDHPMGTDTPGHDVFAQVLHGIRRSVQVALIVALLSTFIGVAIGATAGYFGGRVDGTLMRLTDVVLTIPSIAALAVLGASVQDVRGNWLVIGLILSGLFWARKARLIRTATLSLREEGYVEAARAAGAGHAHIIVRHVLPNAAGLIITSATLTVASAILAEAALSFLGLGISPPDTSLGRLVVAGQGSIDVRPWLFYFPGFAIVVLVLAVNFVGEGLRRALDTTSSTTGPRFGP